MVLTANQTTAFFENADQMALPRATVVQLQTEGILAVADLADFDKDTLSQISENLRRPGGRIPDPSPLANAGATIPTPPFVFGAKSQMRLKVACDLVKYYNTTGRPLTASNIQWDPVMSRFKELWNALKIRRKADDPVTPKISKALPVIRWTEAFIDHLHRCIGVRLVPLAYVTRPDTAVPADVPALATDQPFSTENRSLEGELISRASHTHGLFPDDSADVYYKLEEATRGTSYADSIKPFQRRKDGRGAFLALQSQYAGTDKWEAEIKRQSTLLHTRKWKGQSNFSLERFVQQHRTAYVSMQACSQHVAYQLPNEHSRVGFLLDAIKNDDAGLQAAMANVEDDTGPVGKREDFERAASHLLPKDPVAKKMALRNSEGKRPSAEISETTAIVGKGNQKGGIGKTGVHLRYHKPDEYDALTRPQKKELMEWRAAGGKSTGAARKKKKLISSVVKAATFNDEAKAFYLSYLDAQKKAATIAAAATNAAATVSGTTAKTPDEGNAPNAATASGTAAPSDAAIGSPWLNTPPGAKTKNILKEILRKAKE